MQPDITQKLDALEAKVDAIYKSVEKTRIYFKWTMILTIVLFIAPLIILAFVAPAFISSYTSSLQGLGL